ncbi:helix-turn-helix domain-containing protein [Nocardioides gilvus]|uniref:helix-turn-helix domain-containing protein n=1 Tax=Nocardioides gilvus TaxID=1735589 RepID=UPI000D741F26|nr:RodZ domain-containing protein [Nocardioides gilvus]
MNTAEQYDDNASELDHHRSEIDGAGLTVAGEIVEVRRNAGVSAGVGAVASAVGIAWFGRAIGTGSVLDWALVAVMALLSVSWLAAFVDARTPLLVADAQGVRLRLGRAWLGLPWSAVARVEHRPRRGLLRDGVLNVVPHNPDRLLAEVGPAGKRQARLASRLHGGPLAVPLGLSTKVISDVDLTDALARLAERNAEVVLIDAPQADTELVDVDGVDRADVSSELAEGDQLDVAPTDSPRRGARARAFVSRASSGVTAAIGAVTSRRTHDEVVEDDLEASDLALLDDETASETPEPIRPVTAPARGEVVSIAAVVDETSELVLAETETESVESADETDQDQAGQDEAEQDRAEQDPRWAQRVRPISREGHAVAPLVLDAFDVEPASDPVVGPELRAARTRLGLTTDQLAERTRIRPHVIEAIEVDDFVPCGGDFYARGHLRTLARVLGVNVAPLLTSYDERYAHAPIDPRRVFEAELATGAHGSIRGTRGGPNWSILVAAVMALVLVWSVARLAMDTPDDVSNTPVLNGSGGPQGVGSVITEPVSVTVEAPESGAEVVVRDANGAVVFQGTLAIGESQVVKASPPVRVQSSDGSVTVVVDGAERGAIGEGGEPGQGTYAGE